MMEIKKKPNNKTNQSLFFKWLPIIFTIIGLGLSIYNIIENQSIKNFNIDYNYKINQTKLKPERIIKGFLRLDTLFMRNAGIIETNFTTSMYIKLKNITSMTAKIKFIVYIDSLTTDYFLRDKIFNEDSSDVRYDYFDEFFRPTLMNNDTTTILVDQLLRPRPETVSHIHVLIVYENDIGGIYDTYLIQKVIKNDTTALYSDRVKIKPIDSNSFVRNAPPKEEIVSYREFITDYHSYTTLEKEHFLNFYQLIKKTNLNLVFPDSLKIKFPFKK